MLSKFKNWIIGETYKSLVVEMERIHHTNVVILENKHKKEMERKDKEHESIVAGVRSAAQDYIDARLKEIDSEKLDLEREKKRYKKMTVKYTEQISLLQRNLDEIKDWKSNLGDFERLIGSLAVQYNESKSLIAEGQTRIEESLEEVRISV
ncbi:MAG: hypothetical protein OEZ34_00780 [Spirochaetia bacterium]|nr:hypothetical protein [Spirochaetia bacterium]